jgi:hypothetical protein
MESIIRGLSRPRQRTVYHFKIHRTVSDLGFIRVAGVREGQVAVGKVSRKVNAFGPGHLAHLCCQAAKQLARGGGGSDLPNGEMAAVVPAWAQMKANFVHSVDRMSPLGVSRLITGGAAPGAG